MYRVFLVDDEYLVIRGLRNRIDWSRLNCEVVGDAQRGEEAMEQILKLQPDIVITDIRMPDMDGLALIRALKGKTRAEFIIFSGYGEFEYAQAAIQLDTVDYLLKPVNIEEIERAMRRAEERCERSELLGTGAQDHAAEVQLIRILDGYRSTEGPLDDYGAFIAFAVSGADGPLPDGAGIESALRAAPLDGALLLTVRDRGGLIAALCVREADDMNACRRGLTQALQDAQRASDGGFFWGMGFVCEVPGELVRSHARANELLNRCLFARCQFDEESDGAAPPSARAEIARIRSYIEGHLHAPLTLMDIAAHVYMNPTYVSHIFKKETGENLFDTITAMRIERAKQLLSRTTLKIGEVATQVGYVDQRYFCQVFKKRVGMTATEYRSNCER